MIKRICGVFSLLMLVALLIPSILFVSGEMELDSVKRMMLAATILYFISTSITSLKKQG